MSTIHIYNAGHTACAACGDTYDAASNNAFVSSIGYWNTVFDRCEPDKVMKDDYSLVTRAPDRDNQTASMKEDHKNPKRVNQKKKGYDR